MKNKFIQIAIILFAFIIIPINSNAQKGTKKKVVKTTKSSATGYLFTPSITQVETVVK